MVALYAVAGAAGRGLCRGTVAGFNLAECGKALLVPTAQDGVAIGPLESAGRHTGLFIGQTDFFFAKAPREPRQNVILLPRREPAAGDTEQLLDLPQLRLAQELVLHVDRRLLHGVDAVVGPVIRLFLDRPQRRHARDAARTLPLDAVVDKNRNDLTGKPQIAVDRKQNFKFLVG